jgi:hypothetical protein
MWAFDMNGAPQLTNLQLIDPTGRSVPQGRPRRRDVLLDQGRRLAHRHLRGRRDGVLHLAGNRRLCRRCVQCVEPGAGRQGLRAAPSARNADDCRRRRRDRADDWAEKSEGPPWENVGRKKAEAAAKAVGCRWILPVFKDGQARDRTDFNDLFLREGEQAVAGQVIGAMRSVEAEDAAPGAKIIQIDQVQDESWRDQIPLTSSGNYDGANVEGRLALHREPSAAEGRLRFNLLTKEMELDGNSSRIITSPSSAASCTPSASSRRRATCRTRWKPRLAQPVRSADRLPARPQVGRQARIDTWLTDYSGAPTPPTRAPSAASSSSARSLARCRRAARTTHMPVLEGDQGTASRPRCATCSAIGSSPTTCPTSTARTRSSSCRAHGASKSPSSRRCRRRT